VRAELDVGREAMLELRKSGESAAHEPFSGASSEGRGMQSIPRKARLTCGCGKERIYASLNASCNSSVDDEVGFLKYLIEGVNYKTPIHTDSVKFINPATGEWIQPREAFDEWELELRGYNVRQNNWSSIQRVRILLQKKEKELEVLIKEVEALRVSVRLMRNYSDPRKKI
jgi:hypothetical protein